MTFCHWLQLGGVEVLNTGRTRAYSSALGITQVLCESCPDLAATLGDAPYTTPELDDAPWFDPGVPESGLFAGLVGQSIQGLDAATSSRTPVELIGDGSDPGRFRRAAREIRVTATLLARTEAALAYGRAWLAAALRGEACAGDCMADELCFYAHCPERRGEETSLASGDRAVRHAYDVAVLAGPTPANNAASKRVGGGWMQEIEFGLLAGRPYLYRDPVFVISTGGPGDPGAPVPPPVNCTETTDCTDDPDCPDPEPPLRPIAPVDPCFRPLPPAEAVRSVIQVPGLLLPQWFEMTPLIEIETGDRAMRQITIKFFSNPAQYPCETIDPCAACSEIYIPYLKEGVRFRLDGRIRRATVDCPGGPGLAVAEVEPFGPAGGVFEWPEFDCSAPLCVEVVANRTSVAANARMHFWMVAREDAA